MKRVLSVTAGTVGILLTAGVVIAQDAKAEKGMQVFVAQKCTTCHSIAGKGNPKGPHDGVGSRLSAAELRKWLVDPKEMARKARATRKPPMPLFDHLKPAEVDDLVAYLSTLKSKP